ncbi:hypothetical protein GcM3_057003 [Golovinomyces cichoracearum]|uniref:Uncharacterized protein n=1 Tax=Golovinomyces cichoracearum TaxID=62708 RepID=A0A420IXB9_9PEZI|nr:hypothetical protein GcM3_057003 [Golovinomyces cichoracearum]
MATLPVENSKRSLQSRPPSAVANKIIPAVPLYYVRKRQQFQEERAKARREVKDSAPAKTTAVKKVVNCQTNTTLSQPTKNTVPQVDLSQSIDVLESVPLATHLSKSENVQGNAEHSQSTESSLKLFNEKENLKKDEKEIHGDVIDSKHGKNKADHKSSDPTSPDQPQVNRVNSASTTPSTQQPSATDYTLHNGGIVVCDNSESSKSSPAPPLSASHPIPSFNYEQPATGRYITYQSNCSYSYNLSKEYSHLGHLTPYPRQTCANGYVDPTTVNEGGLILPVGPLDHSPLLNLSEARQIYDTATPHGFHGSQSLAYDLGHNKPFETQSNCSINIDERNGLSNDHQKLHKNYPANLNRAQYPPQPPIIRNHVPQIDMFDGLIEYLSSQFANPTFADYTLELRFADQTSRVHIPGHSLIFSRSITLRDLMLELRSGTNGTISNTILIESDDRFICTDGFFMALRRLYGNPLLDFGSMISIGSARQHQRYTGTINSDRFNLALGYAASGHLLKMDVIVNRGCEIAGLTLHWTNLERALDFALDGGLEPQWRVHNWNPGSFRATYGPCVNIIIVKVIEFVCHNFPANFQLNTTVSEAAFDLRLPKILDQQSSSKNYRLSQIKFGDHLTEGSKQLRIHHSPTVILSRILISLPWELLRYIFESSRLGDNLRSPILRHQILSSVVLEREKRRIKVFESHVPNSERIKNQRWGVVGWKEEVKEFCRDEKYPKLIRTWVDFNTPES